MELKEKTKPSKGKDKTPKTSRADKSRKAVSPATPQKQAFRMMKEKYIRELKDRPKGKEQEAGQTDGQAAEQVQDSGRWAAGELASASKRMIRQGRDYAKKKAETANGFEFTNRFSNSKRDIQTLFEKTAANLGICHKLIRPYTPRHNGKVERSHREDQKRFYSVHSFFSLADFQQQLAVHNRRSNNFPMRPLSWLSPLEFLVQFV